jgi:GNAT superfamily N-acetyltransferase
MAVPPPAITIVPPTEQHRPDWRRLFEGYATFYKMPMTDKVADKVWGWLHDPHHVLKSLVAVTPEGRTVGLAHFREMPRPLAGASACFLDDLFVDPTHRGGRIADRLIGALTTHAKARGWTPIRWITAENNYRARAVYDRLATKTARAVYEINIPS